MDAHTVLQRAAESHVRLVRFLYCDNGGIIRGKATHVNGLARRLSEGIGLTLAMQAFASVDALAAVEGLGPVGEFRLVPDLNTFVVLPYVPHSGMMLCDMLTLERQPWEACPRTFLKRMVAKAAQMGIVMQAAVEHEFYLARATPHGYEPFDRSLCFSSVGFDASAHIMDDIIAALERQGIQVEQFMPELGPGQRDSRSTMPRLYALQITRCWCARPCVGWPSSMTSSPRLLPSHSWIRLAVARISIAASGAPPARLMPALTYCLTPREVVV